MEVIPQISQLLRQDSKVMNEVGRERRGVVPRASEKALGVLDHGAGIDQHRYELLLGGSLIHYVHHALATGSLSTLTPAMTVRLTGYLRGLAAKPLPELDGFVLFPQCPLRSDV